MVKYKVEFDYKKEITACYNCPLCEESSTVVNTGRDTQRVTFAFCPPLGEQLAFGMKADDWREFGKLRICPLKSIGEC